MKHAKLALLVLFVAACSGAQEGAAERLAHARAALEAGRLEEARAHAEAVHDERPEEGDARRMLASIYRSLAERAEEEGELREASTHYTRAAEFEPKRALRASDHFAAFSSGRDAGLSLEELVSHVLASLEADPTNLEVRRVAATTFDELAEPRRAVEHYLWLWEANRADLGVGLRLGTLYLALDEWDDAEAIFLRVLESEPDNVQAKLQLAETYEDMGRSARARQTYQALQEEHPDNAMILFRYADFLTRRGEESRAEAIRARARGELPGVERREMRELKRRR